MKTDGACPNTIQINRIARRRGMFRIARLLLLLLLARAASLHAQFTFITNNGTITITKYTGPGGDVVIPAETNGFPVTTIDGGKGAFKGSRVTSVIIPNSVTNIGSSAFSLCTNLTSITIPDSVIYIRDSAFYRCDRLTDIALGSGVAGIDSFAFGTLQSCTLTNGSLYFSDPSWTNYPLRLYRIRWP